MKATRGKLSKQKKAIVLKLGEVQTFIFADYEPSKSLVGWVSKIQPGPDGIMDIQLKSQMYHEHSRQTGDYFG